MGCVLFGRWKNGNLKKKNGKMKNDKLILEGFARNSKNARNSESNSTHIIQKCVNYCKNLWFRNLCSETQYMNDSASKFEFGLS